MNVGLATGALDAERAAGAADERRLAGAELAGDADDVARLQPRRAVAPSVSVSPADSVVTTTRPRLARRWTRRQKRPSWTARRLGGRLRPAAARRRRGRRGLAAEQLGQPGKSASSTSSIRGV